MKKLEGASFYEERLLFLLIRLRNPRARVVFVTSQPVHPLVLEYYFQLLVGIPTSHARSRLTLLCAHDASPRPLTEKILERPRLLERIRQGIADRARAYLTVFNSTPLERKLAVLLGIPLNGVDPALNAHGTKSGSRKIFREAGIALPDGFEDLRDDRDIEAALVELKRRKPGLRRRGREAERQLLRRRQRALSLSRAGRQPRRGGPRAPSRASRSRCPRRRGTSTVRSSAGWAASPRSSSRPPSRPLRASSSGAIPTGRSSRSPRTTRSWADRAARCSSAASFRPPTRIACRSTRRPCESAPFSPRRAS